MSDRGAFEKWCETQESTYHKSGMWKAWQAAQAQAGDGEAVAEIQEYKYWLFCDNGEPDGFEWRKRQVNNCDLLKLPHGTKLYTVPQPAVNQQLLEAIKVCASFLSDFGLENSDAYQQALFAIAAAQEQK